MATWNCTVTNKGALLQAKQVNGASITFTKIMSGTGIVSLMKLKEQLFVTGEKQLLSMELLKMGNKQYTITIFLSNDDLTDSYNLSQIGFYAEDPDDGEILFAIAQIDTPKKIPTSEDSPGYNIEFSFTFKNDNETPVEITPSYAGYVTKTEFNEKVPLKATASGTETILEVEVNDIQLSDSLNILITLTKDLGKNPFIKYNNGEAYPLFNSNGKEIKDGQQIAGTVLNAIFNEEKACWYLVGGGSNGQGFLTMTYEEWIAWKASDEYDESQVVAITDDYSGEYLINDEKVSKNTTYSSEKIELILEKTVLDAVIAAKAVTGAGNSTTVFDSDGNITQTYTDGRVTTTVFNADGSIVEITTKDGLVVHTKTTTFNSDGSITEVET